MTIQMRGNKPYVNWEAVKVSSVTTHTTDYGFVPLPTADLVEELK